MTTSAKVEPPVQAARDPRIPSSRTSLLWRIRRGRGILFGGLWLFFLVVPLMSALDRHPGQLGWQIGIWLVTVTFACAYAYTLIFGGPRGPGDRARRWTVLAILVVLSLFFCIAAGQAGLFTFIYLAAAGTSLLRGKVALGWVVTLLVSTFVLPEVVPGWEFEVGTAMGVGLSAVASWGFVQLVRRNWQLQEAQQEIARLAVDQERTRFSRDLHDILGHSLTVITVKSELAGKLISRDPARALAEIQDVERLSREALADVRATAAGYRTPSLAAELARASQLLEAAGLEAVLPNSVDEVPGSARELFGWVVREGVTNVVRHSKATRCTVTISPTTIEVSDNGVGPAGRLPGGGDCDDKGGAKSSGNGLTGLRERVEAAGGVLNVRPGTDGGFAIRVELPAATEKPTGNGKSNTVSKGARGNEVQT